MKQDPDRFRMVKWCPRAYGYVDPQKEVAAYKVSSALWLQDSCQSSWQSKVATLMICLKQRQAELAMLDEKNIVLDTDPSEVNGGGGAQAGLGIGAVPAFSDTERPGEDKRNSQNNRNLSLR